MQQFTPSNLFFIDRTTFEQSINKNLSLEEFVKEVIDCKLQIDCKLHSKPSKLLSDITLEKLIFLNSALYPIYHPNSFISPPDIVASKNSDMNKYIVHSLTKYLLEPKELPDSSYEIIPLNFNQTEYLVVVVGESFIFNLTKSKAEFCNFCLKCLSYQYKSGSSMMDLLNLYLSVRTEESNLRLIQLRLSSFFSL